MWRPTGRAAVAVADVVFGAPPVSRGSVDPTQHLTGRLYYPSTLPTAASSRGWWPRRRSIPWLPGWQYAHGMGRFLFFRTSGSIFWCAQQCLALFSWAVGSMQRIAAVRGGALADLGDQLPVVVFSHGLGGNRALYSILCCEMASQGYVVLAVEHADGTASCAALAGGGWRHYAGLGGEEAQVDKTRHRVQEMKTALRVLQALHRGENLQGLTLSDGLDATNFLRQRLDFRCLAAVGHSYGGATVTALVAEDSRWRCAIALDPWWYALFPEAAALRHWQTRTPLFIMPSHDWSIPNSFGQLACGSERQEKVLEAAKAREGGGGGALLLVISGSSHNTFADALPLFSRRMAGLLERLGLSARLDPVLGIHLAALSMLSYLASALPLSTAQLAAQNWQPDSDSPLLRAIRGRDAADKGTPAPRKGFFSWLFPGRGLVTGLSDWALNRLLGGAPVSTVAAISKGGSSTPQPRRTSPPDDVVSGVEALEAALPSAEPASGLHPHAPAQRTDSLELNAVRPLSGGQHAHCEQLVALLGEEHVFKCRIV